MIDASIVQARAVLTSKQGSTKSMTVWSSGDRWLATSIFALFLWFFCRSAPGRSPLCTTTIPNIMHMIRNTKLNNHHKWISTYIVISRGAGFDRGVNNKHYFTNADKTSFVANMTRGRRECQLVLEGQIGRRRAVNTRKTQIASIVRSGCYKFKKINWNNEHNVVIKKIL